MLVVLVDAFVLPYQLPLGDIRLGYLVLGLRLHRGLGFIGLRV